MAFENIIKKVANTFANKYHDNFVEEKGHPGSYLVSNDDMSVLREFIMISPMINSTLTIKFFTEACVERTLKRYSSFRNEDEILAIITSMITAANAIICYAAMEASAVIIQKHHDEQKQMNYRTPEQEYLAELERLKRVMSGDKNAAHAMYTGAMDDPFANLDENFDPDNIDDPFTNLEFYIEWPPENPEELY